RAEADGRHQESGLALDGRIRRREVRHVGEWLAKKFEACVLEINHLLALIVNDARRLDLPQRRFLRIVPARSASGVYAAVEDGEISVRPIGARRRQASLVGRVEAQ